MAADNARAFDAILLDLDGTLVTDDGTIHPRTLAQARLAHQRGIRVMVATGRSLVATRHILEQLDFDTTAIVFNGAGVFCPTQGRLIEERVLSGVVVRNTLRWSQATGALPVFAGARHKFSLAPRTEHEERALQYFRGIQTMEPEEISHEYLIRATAFSAAHEHSHELAASLLEAVERPVYITHFPLSALADHRDNPLLVADVQPPCRGKAEGLRVLWDRYGIAPERVVAVGDATNDLSMFEAAGLSVAMGNAMPEAKAHADRVIGSNNSDTIAELLDELFHLS